MDIWLTSIASLCVAAVIGFLHFRSDGKKLPPGPSLFFSNFILLLHSFSQLETILKNLKPKYGPIITLFIGSHPSIFVGNNSVAHQLLVLKQAIFSDRPIFSGRPTPGISSVRNICSAPHGPTWTALRRNLAAEYLHPSRMRSYSRARKSALQFLFGRLQGRNEATGIEVLNHSTDAIFRLMVVMCFGEKPDDRRISEIATVQHRLLKLVTSGRVHMFRRFPRLWKLLFRDSWKEFVQTRNDHEDVFIRHIMSRIEAANSATTVGDGGERIVAYVDTLLNLEVPNEDGNKVKLTHREMVTMCSEFLNAGTDNTATVLQWIMANLVRDPEIQSNLYNEIVTVVGPPPPPPPPGVEPDLVINEENMEKMPYLKAVILEALRRHPPGHFLGPHRVTRETQVRGFTIPEGATVNFMVAEMGLNPAVWDDPMEFRPERFLVNSDEFDITGRKEITMMPFGAGPRICPGMNLALLHLQYFVANLVWYFYWQTPVGYDVDLSEKVQSTVVMKNPLQAKIYSRTQTRPVESSSGSGPVVSGPGPVEIGPVHRFFTARDVIFLAVGVLISGMSRNRQ